MFLFNYFEFEGRELRVLTDKAGKPWFVAKDVCSLLGLRNTTVAIRRLHRKDRITLRNLESNPRDSKPHWLNFISQSGLIALLYRSHKPKAENVLQWLEANVLPALNTRP